VQPTIAPITAAPKATAPPAAPPTTVSAAAKANPSAAARTPTVRTPAPSAPPAPAAPAEPPPSAPVVAETKPPAEAAAAAAPPAAPAKRPAIPDVTIARLKLLIMDDEGTRDQDASLRFGRDGLEVVDGETPLNAASYSEVLGVFYSHSKEPRWATADGHTEPVAKAGSVLGFLKGTPDWITVRTGKRFIAMRVRSEDVRRITTEFETRTATRVVTIR
jgi:hypothetical protein